MKRLRETAAARLLGPGRSGVSGLKWTVRRADFQAPPRDVARVAMVPLGCAKNMVDAEIMLGLLQQSGFRVTGEPRRADVVIVNTCAFIDEAKQESIETILSLADGRPVIVAGCLAQRYPDQLLREIPEIAAVVGTNDFPEIVSVARRVLQGERVRSVGHQAARYDRIYPRRRLAGGPFAYVKVGEGCNHDCRFCAIPSFRGRFRSRPLELLQQEVAGLPASAREVVLVSQDTTSWGRDLALAATGRRSHLGDLLAGLGSALPDSAAWMRCLYLYPYLLDDRMLAAWAETPRALPYFDIPLQHGADGILSAMGRPDRRTSILRLTQRLRAQFPDCVLRTSFIVGYPGETEEHFGELLSLLEEAAFDHAGFFVYSDEDGTPAASLPGSVPETLRHERYHRAMDAQTRIAARRNASRVGRTLDTLIERPVAGQPGYWEGRWWGQAPEGVDGIVTVRADALAPGVLCAVRIEGVDGSDLYGAPRDDAPARAASGSSGLRRVARGSRAMRPHGALNRKSWR